MRCWLLFACLCMLGVSLLPAPAAAKSADWATVTVAVRVEPSFHLPLDSFADTGELLENHDPGLSNDPDLEWKVSVADDPPADRTLRRVIFWVVLPGE